LEDVHDLCNELGFTNPEDTMRFIETASKEELEALIEKVRRKRKKKKGEVGAVEYDYVYAS
jgi:hypothetical protein